uniref:Uncharacterized protein n=1 Tax=Ascaris lumbricoides TaxID=6252 RepID=A0A9J2PTT9_ASCLU
MTTREFSTFLTREGVSADRFGCRSHSENFTIQRSYLAFVIDSYWIAHLSSHFRSLSTKNVPKQLGGHAQRKPDGR